MFSCRCSKCQATFVVPRHPASTRSTCPRCGNRLTTSAVSATLAASALRDVLCSPAASHNKPAMAPPETPLRLAIFRERGSTSRPAPAPNPCTVPASRVSDCAGADQPSAPANSAGTVGESPSPRLPPDEKFWKRYSPHHEFPLSTVASIAIHAMVGAVILCLGWMLVRSLERKPLPIEPIRLAEGGRNPLGAGSSKGGPLPQPAEAADNTPPESVPTNTKPESDPEPLKLPERKLPDPVTKENNVLKRLLERGKTAIKGFDRVNAETQRKLFDGLRMPGDGEGFGVGQQRAKRLSRWRILVSLNAEECRRQMRALDFVVAIPEPGGLNSHRVFRDLNVPVRGRDEDLSNLGGRLWWSMEDEVLRVMPQVLMLSSQPPYAIGFFPREFEEKLAVLEKRYRGRNEDEIHATEFAIEKRGNSYEPEVVSQH